VPVKKKRRRKEEEKRRNPKGKIQKEEKIQKRIGKGKGLLSHP